MSGIVRQLFYLITFALTRNDGYYGSYVKCLSSKPRIIRSTATYSSFEFLDLAGIYLGIASFLAIFRRRRLILVCRLRSRWRNFRSGVEEGKPAAQNIQEALRRMMNGSKAAREGRRLEDIVSCLVEGRGRRDDGAVRIGANLSRGTDLAGGPDESRLLQMAFVSRRRSGHASGRNGGKTVLICFAS